MVVKPKSEPWFWPSANVTPNGITRNPNSSPVRLYSNGLFVRIGYCTCNEVLLIQNARDYFANTLSKSVTMLRPDLDIVLAIAAAAIHCILRIA